jgi:hypothetical protein
MADTFLTIAAEDAEDLEVISAQLQDAVARIKDLVYLPKQRRFAALFNRFKWEEADARGANLRVRAGLHFDNVLSVKAHRLKRGNPLAVVSLLAVRYDAGLDDRPNLVELLFAGGGKLRLEVECLSAGLSDISGSWTARARPDHDRVSA